MPADILKNSQPTIKILEEKKEDIYIYIYISFDLTVKAPHPLIQ